jgi:hypothetical protein
MTSNANSANTLRVPSTFYNHQKDAMKIAKRSSKSMYRQLIGENHPPNTPIYRGGLIYHGTGTGKTVTGLGLVMEYLHLQNRLATYAAERGAVQSNQIPANLKGPYICIVTLKSNKDQNGLEKYLKNLMLHYPQYARGLIQGLMNQETGAQIESLKKAFSARVKYFSFIEFASCLELYGGGRNRVKDPMCNQLRVDWKKRGLVVIIDEAHELTKAKLSDLRESGRISDTTKNEYQGILRTKKFILENSGSRSKPEAMNPLLHVYAMTATVGTSPEQVVDTINMVRPANMKPRTKENIGTTRLLPRFVSYADLKHNRDLFAKVDEKNITVPIHQNHYAIITHKVGEYRKKQIDKKLIVPGQTNYTVGNKVKKLPKEYTELTFRPYAEKEYLKEAKKLQHSFTIADAAKVFGSAAGATVFDTVSREYYNYCKAMVTGKIPGSRYPKTFPGHHLTADIHTSMTGKTKTSVCIAPKLMKVLQNAIGGEGKQYIYTSDIQTLRIMRYILEQVYAMKDITEDVKSGKVTNAVLTAQLNRQKKRTSHNNFIAMESATGLNIIQNFMSGIDMVKERGDTGRLVTEDVTIEKMKRNANGENCRIILVTGELFTGVDINALRGVHIVEPFASTSSYAQAYGRAARSKGHAFLPNTKRNATVYVYYTTVGEWNWNKNEMKKPAGQTLFVSKLSQSHEAKQLTAGVRDRVLGGRQWANGSMRRRGATVRDGYVNNMNTNQTLFPTPDELLHKEQTDGPHTATMVNFMSKFNRAIRGTNNTNNNARRGLKRKSNNA